MSKAESLGPPSKQTKSRHGTNDPEVIDSVKKAESSPLTRSDGRSRSAERIRASKQKDLKRHSASPIQPLHTEPTEATNLDSPAMKKKQKEGESCPVVKSNKKETDSSLSVKPRQEDEGSESELNNLQHPAQFTITILPQGSSLKKSSGKKDKDKYRDKDDRDKDRDEEKDKEERNSESKGEAKSSPPSTTTSPRAKGMRPRYQSDVTHLPREKVFPQNGSVVKLNVGGTRFMTTMDSLKSRGPNFLTLMVTNDRKGIIPALTDDKGYYFVDRSGDLFKIVLEYLRTASLHLPDYISKAQIIAEFDFYQIQTPFSDHGKLKQEIADKVDEMKEAARTWLNDNKPGIEKFIRDQCTNGVSRASLLAYLHKASNNYQTRLSGGVILCWPDTSIQGRGNNMWLDVFCHIVKSEWGIFTTWTSYDSSSFQVDFDLSATALSQGSGSVYGLLKSWERSYARGPGLYVYKSWIK